MRKKSGDGELRDLFIERLDTNNQGLVGLLGLKLPIKQ